jgi:hypothetical protein
MVTPTPIGRSPQSRRDDVAIAVPDTGGRGDHHATANQWRRCGKTGLKIVPMVGMDGAG